MNTADKWLTWAALLGVSTARGMYAAWARNPEHWTLGFGGMKKIAITMARDQVFFQMPDRVRKREEVIEAAARAAAETADTFIAVYKRAQKDVK